MAVGAVGFGVDASALTLLHGLWSWDPIQARLLSFSVAVTATWALNRAITFPSERAVPRLRQYLRYCVVNGIGALINLGVFAMLVWSYPLMGSHPLLPLAIASASALIFNFLGSRYLVFHAAS